MTTAACFRGVWGCKCSYFCLELYCDVDSSKKVNTQTEPDLHSTTGPLLARTKYDANRIISHTYTDFLNVYTYIYNWCIIKCKWFLRQMMPDSMSHISLFCNVKEITVLYLTSHADYTFTTKFYYSYHHVDNTFLLYPFSWFSSRKSEPGLNAEWVTDKILDWILWMLSLYCLNLSLNHLSPDQYFYFKLGKVRLCRQKNNKWS